MNKGLVNKVGWVGYDLWGVWIEVYGGNLKKIFKGILKMVK